MAKPLLWIIAKPLLWIITHNQLKLIGPHSSKVDIAIALIHRDRKRSRSLEFQQIRKI